MSVAKCLGVDDLDAPNMRELQAEWPRWRRLSSDLPRVDDLNDLPRWMQNAEPGQRDAVLTALRTIADIDRRAYVILAWLLMPGASKIAGRQASPAAGRHHRRGRRRPALDSDL